MDNFIQNNTQRPDVVFGGVDVVLQSLRTHVEGTANIGGLLWVCRCPFSKAKVSNFGYLVFEEDVGGFKVPVEEA